MTDRSAPDAAALAAALLRVADGDRAAFERLYRHSSAKLFGVCLRILGDRGQAEEVVQEVYLAVWRRAGSFDSARGSAMTWLATLARNRAIDRLRAGGRVASAPIELAEAVADPAPHAADLAEADEESRRVAACIAELERGEALLIRTAFVEGSTYAEIATRSATPLGTVKSRIRRALTKLRACLS